MIRVEKNNRSLTYNRTNNYAAISSSGMIQTAVEIQSPIHWIDVKHRFLECCDSEDNFTLEVLNYITGRI